jgi:hypothetical protein
MYRKILGEGEKHVHIEKQNIKMGRYLISQKTQKCQGKHKKTLIITSGKGNADTLYFWRISLILFARFTLSGRELPNRAAIYESCRSLYRSLPDFRVFTKNNDITTVDR